MNGLMEKIYPINQLTDEIELIKDREILNKELYKRLNKEFNEKNLNKRTIAGIFDGTKKVDDLTEYELMTFAFACYRTLKKNDERNERLNVERYFSKKRIEDWEEFKDVSKKVNQVEFKECLRIDDFNYRFNIPYEKIALYFNNMLLGYNQDTQRSAVYKVLASGKSVREIQLKKKGVEEIANLILKNEFEESEIILNLQLEKNKFPKFEFNPINDYYHNIGDINIEPNSDESEIKILDGMHRISGIIRAVQINKEKGNPPLEGSIGCKLVVGDEERGKRIVGQVFTRSDDDKDWLKSLREDDYDKFANEIIKNSKTFNNKVAITFDEAKNDNSKITAKYVISNTAKDLGIQVNNLSVKLFDSKAIVNFIDTLFNNIKMRKIDFTDINNNINIYAGYITLAYRLKDEDLSEQDYNNIIDLIKENINEKMIIDLKLKLKNYSNKKIIDYFTMIAEVIKNG